jgi:hypothetical protein
VQFFRRVMGLDEVRALPGPKPEAIDVKIVMEQFVAAAQTIYRGWDTYPSPADRMTALTAAANAALTSVGVPAMNPAVDPGLKCQFEAGPWTITMPLGFFGVKPAEDRMIQVATTVYHEARHAEQYWNMARMLAGQGKTPQEIHAACGNMDMNKVMQASAPGNHIAPTDPRAARYQQMLTNLNDPANVTLIQQLKVQKPAVEAAAMAWKAASQANDPNEPTLRANMGSLMATFVPLMKQYNAMDAEADALGIETQVKALW